MGFPQKSRTFFCGIRLLPPLAVMMATALGRLSDASNDVLNVFIHGDMPEKIQHISRLYHVSEQEAVKLIADTDKRRMTNYNFYTGQKWGKASNYTLCLNSSQLGYGRCEAVIMECR